MMGRELAEQSLRRKIAMARAGAARRTLPDSVREEVLEHARRECAHGRTARDVAGALGIHEVTLSKWKRDAARLSERGAFREVALLRPAPSPVLRVAHARTGLVVEGLDLDGLVDLIARLSS